MTPSTGTPRTAAQTDSILGPALRKCKIAGGEASRIGQNALEGSAQFVINTTPYCMEGLDKIWTFINPPPPAPEPGFVEKGLQWLDPWIDRINPIPGAVDRFAAFINPVREGDPVPRPRSPNRFSLVEQLEQIATLDPNDVRPGAPRERTVTVSTATTEKMFATAAIATTALGFLGAGGPFSAVIFARGAFCPETIKNRDPIAMTIYHVALNQIALIAIPATAANPVMGPVMGLILVAAATHQAQNILMDSTAGLATIALTNQGIEQSTRLFKHINSAKNTAIEPFERRINAFMQQRTLHWLKNTHTGREAADRTDEFLETNPLFHQYPGLVGQGVRPLQRSVVNEIGTLPTITGCAIGNAIGSIAFKLLVAKRIANTSVGVAYSSYDSARRSNIKNTNLNPLYTRKGGRLSKFINESFTTIGDYLLLTQSAACGYPLIGAAAYIMRPGRVQKQSQVIAQVAGATAFYLAPESTSITKKVGMALAITALVNGSHRLVQYYRRYKKLSPQVKRELAEEVLGQAQDTGEPAGNRGRAPSADNGMGTGLLPNPRPAPKLEVSPLTLSMITGLPMLSGQRAG